MILSFSHSTIKKVTKYCMIQSVNIASMIDNIGQFELWKIKKLQLNMLGSRRISGWAVCQGCVQIQKSNYY